MLSNTLHVNLLLTGILAQLAAYPQPLLRSFLLNTNLVFQPTVRSLYQVRATKDLNRENETNISQSVFFLLFFCFYLMHHLTRDP